MTVANRSSHVGSTFAFHVTGSEMPAQLALYETTVPRSEPSRPTRPRQPAPLCAACRAREARYGFHPSTDDPTIDRPRTLCFECFRLEMGRRQEAAHAVQRDLPLNDTLAELDRRRRRAQIAARRAVGVR
jgi:hypothetical protein